MTGSSTSPKSADSYRRIWKVVREIPRGRVATYGQVALMAGLGGHARMAGYALHAATAELDLPWHRVINSRGSISLPVADGRYDLQKSLLEREGIVFSGERISLHRYQWRPTVETE